MEPSQPQSNRASNKRLLTIATFLLLLVICGILWFVPNPIGAKLSGWAKANGYLNYTPEEATKLAYSRCGGCHEVEKIIKYCARCGPPFIIVSNFMQKYIDVANTQGANIAPFTTAELMAIIQVWNGLVGNWEADWRKDDLKKLLAINPALLPLLETPPDQRPIENALRTKAAPGSYKNYNTGGVPKENTNSAPPRAGGH